MLTSLTQNIERVLLQRILERYQVQYERLSFSIPPKIELGELALPIAFDLARKVKRPPRDIAQELADDARKIPGVWKVDVAGAGYLNLFLDRANLALSLADSIDGGGFGRTSAPQFPGKVIVEHTNINPNKAAHIGHLRNAAFGDSFVRCLRFLGHTVEVQNYLDNTGRTGCRRRGRAGADAGPDARAGRGHRGEVRLLLLGRLCPRLRSSTRQSRKTRRNDAASRCRRSKPATIRPPSWPQHVAMRVVRAHLATMTRINVRVRPAAARKRDPAPSFLGDRLFNS